MQILAAFLAVSVVVGPFVEEDEPETEATTAERSTTTERWTTTTEARTTTTERETTTTEATTTTTQPTTSRPTTTTTEAPATTTGPTRTGEFDDPVAQQAYDTERGICADCTPEEVAAEAPVTPRSMSPADVADANSKGYQPRYQAAALLGCLAGFQDQGLSGP